MKLFSALHGFGALHRFTGDHEGVSAVEFALILPSMVAVYLGSVELNNGMSVKYKTTLAARSVADLASQYVTIDTPTLNKILGAATTILSPYSAADVTVTVSEVTTTNSTGAAKITWSAANAGSGRAVGSSVTLPTSLQTLPTGTALILGEVNYPYSPQFGYVLTGVINLYQGQYFYPRQSSCVSYNNAC